MFVYVLKDPRGDQEIRYVGKTSRDVETRLKEHVKNAKYEKKDNHCKKWIRSLANVGLLPIAESIGSYSSEEELNDAEIFYIAHYRFAGCNLTNGTNGGEGKTGSHTKEHGINISKGRGGKPFWDQFGNYYVTQQECAKVLGISHSLVSIVLKKKTESSFGYKFSYEKPEYIEFGPIHPIPKAGTTAYEDWRRQSHSSGAVYDQNGVMYSSQTDAARKIGIDQAKIHDILMGRYKQTHGHTFAYVENGIPKLPEKRGFVFSPRALVDHNGTIYKSVHSASKITGVSTSQIHYILCGKYKQALGYAFAYLENGTPDLPNRERKNSKYIVDQNGKLYKSVAEAAKVLGTSRRHVRDVINNRRPSLKGYILRVVDKTVALHNQSQSLSLAEGIANTESTGA